MANKVISIEIGNSITRIVQMDYMTKNPKIYRHVTIPTPEGIINDGYLNNDIPTLADAIKKVIADEKMNGTKNVTFTIASSKILTREVMIPAVKSSMVDSTVRMNLTEYFPIDLSQHEVSTLKLETIKEGDNAGKHRVLIVAAEKDLIKTYEDFAKLLDLVLLQVDYVGNSIYQCFKNEDSTRCNMILKVEENQTSITIVDHQNLLLQRNISYGFEEVIQEVANRPAFGVKTYEEAAEYIKHNASILENLSDTASSISSDEPNENKAGSALLEAKASVTRAMSGFINAVSRVVDFYNSKYSVPIDRIYVCGLGGDFTGINTLLTNEMGIKTHILKKLDEIQWIATTDVSGFHCYAAAIGAGIAPIGLYSKAKEDKAKRATNYKGLGLLIIGLAAAVCVALVVPKIFENQELKAENERLKNLEVQYEAAEQIYNTYQTTLSVYQQVYAANMMIENPNDNLLIFFNELEKKLPEDTKISGFTSNEVTCTISFVVGSKEEAAGIINMLRDFDSLTDVSLSAITETHAELTDEDKAKAKEKAEADATANAETDNTEADEKDTDEKVSVSFTVTCTYLPSGNTNSEDGQ